ncbi:helicase DnaB [Streptomyces sp. Je 1-4]|uniref:DnaB-like helicase N-terminal domain-containing protein n=1 Tax=Streptomyces TaxID=1883 RepID=UPI0021D7D4E2|nr:MULTISPECIES: DnaB-like helicase N-terminal domain-containing protein [unclassified Streptomyces]UYB40900.1 helicase DnaB [Streptomyces sp. Je 1-4]UZQ37059.1 helicase DnaB [Streptomyces sp. Je 1-4] [Streptomyces sp. Je 1-4 4N24]UZQ44476.1 helicase DnaB [Streptomyces sp. Je 1-4] [Streptomyces sp. Je 1-4 4N24_ara]
MTPLVQAEQAVLGAVFLAPGQLAHLSPWLRPEHFSRPVHTALYAAMLKLRADDHPAAKAQGAGPVPMSWMADTVAEASQHTRGLTASYAHSLVSACPRPEHAVVYGRMVLEGAIHRSVTQHATRLHQAARADAIRGGVEETVHHAQVLTDVLSDLARRWGGEPRPVAPPASAPPPPVHPQPVDEQLLADEEFLLGCLSARPQKLDEVVGWLHPSDFADAGHQQIYRSLGALHHRGEPIDQLTVLWEIQRRGALADQTLDTERVLRICDPSAFAGSAEYVGEQVVKASLVRTAAASARQVRALADDESLAPGRLIGYALHALGPLEDVRRRWRIATGTEPEPRLTEGQPGAGPPAARIEAARSRSRPHFVDAAPATAPTAASRPAVLDRPHRRSPS